MSLYIPKMSDTPAITIPGLANNFNLLASGRIVEQGENENGYYARWESGLQICTSPLFKVPCDITIAGTDWHYTSSENAALWRYPALFSIVYAVQAVNIGLGAAGASIRNVTNTSVALGIFTGEERDGTAVADTVQGLAIGRWK